MKPQHISAAEFRAELKRLNLGQSSFAAIVEVPLRTVQSWALGERSIPRTAGALIEKVERMPLKDRFVAIALTLSEKKLKALVDVAQVMGDQAKEIRALREETDELRANVSKLNVAIERLQETCVFQANKITTYAQDLKRRATSVVPFNN
jgi:Mg2+ and Co2+ transporter CorA